MRWILQRRFRLSAQLYAGIGGAVLLTIAASLVGWYSFDRVGDVHSRVNDGTVPELAAAFGVARYSGTLVAAGTRLIAAATPSEIESVADGIAQAHQAFEGQLATLERSDLSGEHLGPVRAHADGLIANLDAIGDDRAELLELAQRSDAMWVELAGLRNRLDRVVIPGIDDQLFYTMTGNCSDLRGSADYWAHCGGATEHGISTANRFRPLKREQLR